MISSDQPKELNKCGAKVRNPEREMVFFFGFGQIKRTDSG